MENKFFNQDELSQLELLDIKGGVNTELDTIQIECPNNVVGCACDISANEVE
ncbi:hypothetical protein [Proteiniphilum sp. X52]|uniref:hypothetical protein n=1 Tax=Proteiniphilum sp. X52 TaxID=2382159 RepID=UPI001626B652|nr:hypothetical protein [Proteiniphilum sp. X52]